MQQKNLLVFLVLSALIMAGSVWLQHQLFPPPKPGDADRPEPKKMDTQAKVGPKKVEPEAKVGPQPPKEKPKEKPSPPPVVKQAPAEHIQLGGKDFFLQALLTSKGAGVQQVALNQFQGADWLGRPTDSKLELVPDDPELPSFLLYHFPDSEAAHPVLTLGEHTWNVERDKPGANPVKTDDQGVQEIRFWTFVPDPEYEHLKITKIYRLGPRDYHLGLALEITYQGQPRPQHKNQPFRYQLAGAHGLPIEGEWYTNTFRNAVIGVVNPGKNLLRELEESSHISYRAGGDRVPGDTLGDNFLQYAGVATQYFASMIVVDDQQAPTDPGGVDPRNVLAWARPTLESKEVKGKIQTLQQHQLVLDADKRGQIFTFGLLPRTRTHVAAVPFQEGDKVVVSYYETSDGRYIATWIRAGQEYRPMMDDITVRVHSTALELQPGGKVVHKYLLYHGPVKPKLLGQFRGAKAVDPDLVDHYTYRLHLRTLTDYRSAGPLGTFAQAIHWTDLLIACTNVMHWLLDWLHWLVPDYGLTIILLTVLVRGLMFPVSRRQAYISIKMQELGPEVRKIQEKHKNDPQARTQATMALYRQHQVNPMGGCLPMLMQMPVFLGLYFALQESIHFRLGSSVFFWMSNLAAPDMLLWWGEFVPWFTDPDSQGGFIYLGPYLNLLPIIAVVLMVVQQKLMMPPPADEQQAVQQKTMKWMMIFFGILFYRMASGLCLYFIASSLWGLAERRLLPKKPSPETALASQESLTPPPPAGGRKKQRGGTKKDEGHLQKVRAWWADVLKQARKK